MTSVSDLKQHTDVVRCAFCKGSGKDPFGIMSDLSTCAACRGTGRVGVKTPFVRCAHCRGSGAIKTFRCTVCGGKGVVSAPTGATVLCPECTGTGDDTSVPAMACLGCHGRGWVAGEREQECASDE
jgi:DnaJ-class molecular chaperone